MIRVDFKLIYVDHFAYMYWFPQKERRVMTASKRTSVQEEDLS